MIWRLLAVLRRIGRELLSPSQFSREWHHAVDRQSWQSDYEFPTWQPKEVGKRAYRVERD